MGEEEARQHTNGGNGGDDFTELQLVENRGLSRSVQTDHQNSHLLLPPQPVEELGEGETHVGGFGMGRDGYLLDKKNVNGRRSFFLSEQAGKVSWMITEVLE